QEITPIVSDEMKRFTPLEDTPAQEITPIVNDEMKRFTPLENTPAQEIESSVSPEGTELRGEQETFIGKYIPPEFDIHAPIHLLPPEKPQDPPTERWEKVEKKPSIDVLESSPGLRSFLEEIQTYATQPLAPTLPKSEIERIRKAYLEYLIAKRPNPASPVSSLTSKPTSLIDDLIAKLEKITPPATTEQVPTLEVPQAPTPSVTPLVYTESMARVYWQQGDLAKAREILHTLQSQIPEKQTLYAEWLSRIESGLPPP
ncbi:MAG: hypothetical protein ACUVRD_05270, partial [Bacteroidia bacterium]